MDGREKIWTGRLLNKDKYLAEVSVSVFCDAAWPCKVGDVLNIRSKAVFSKLRTMLPQPVFTCGNPKRYKSRPVNIGSSQYFYCEVHPHSDPMQNYRRLLEFFYEKQWVGIVTVTSSNKLYLIPTSSLSHTLGLSDMTVSARLHGLLVCENTPSPRDIRRMYADNPAIRIKKKKGSPPPVPDAHPVMNAQNHALACPGSEEGTSPRSSTGSCGVKRKHNEEVNDAKRISMLLPREPIVNGGDPCLAAAPTGLLEAPVAESKADTSFTDVSEQHFKPIFIKEEPVACVGIDADSHALAATRDALPSNNIMVYDKHAVQERDPALDEASCGHSPVHRDTPLLRTTLAKQQELTELSATAELCGTPHQPLPKVRPSVELLPEVTSAKIASTQPHELVAEVREATSSKAMFEEFQGGGLNVLMSVATRNPFLPVLLAGLKAQQLDELVAKVNGAISSFPATMSMDQMMDHLHRMVAQSLMCQMASSNAPSVHHSSAPPATGKSSSAAVVKASAPPVLPATPPLSVRPPALRPPPPPQPPLPPVLCQSSPVPTHNEVVKPKCDSYSAQKLNPADEPMKVHASSPSGDRLHTKEELSDLFGNRGQACAPVPLQSFPSPTTKLAKHEPSDGITGVPCDNASGATANGTYKVLPSAINIHSPTHSTKGSPSPSTKPCKVISSDGPQDTCRDKQASRLGKLSRRVMEPAMPPQNVGNSEIDVIGNEAVAIGDPVKSSKTKADSSPTITSSGRGLGRLSTRLNNRSSLEKNSDQDCSDEVGKLLRESSSTLDATPVTTPERKATEKCRSPTAVNFVAEGSSSRGDSPRTPASVKTISLSKATEVHSSPTLNTSSQVDTSAPSSSHETPPSQLEVSPVHVPSRSSFLSRPLSSRVQTLVDCEPQQQIPANSKVVELLCNSDDNRTVPMEIESSESSDDAADCPGVVEYGIEHVNTEWTCGRQSTDMQRQAATQPKGIARMSLEEDGELTPESATLLPTSKKSISSSDAKPHHMKSTKQRLFSPGMIAGKILSSIDKESDCEPVHIRPIPSHRLPSTLSEIAFSHTLQSCQENFSIAMANCLLSPTDRLGPSRPVTPVPNENPLLDVLAFDTYRFYIHGSAASSSFINAKACIVCEGGALVERGSIGTLAHTIQPSMTLSSTENLSTVTDIPQLFFLKMNSAVRFAHFASVDALRARRWNEFFPTGGVVVTTATHCLSAPADQLQELVAFMTGSQSSSPWKLKLHPAALKRVFEMSSPKTKQLLSEISDSILEPLSDSEFVDIPHCSCTNLAWCRTMCRIQSKHIYSHRHFIFLDDMNEDESQPFFEKGIGVYSLSEFLSTFARTGLVPSAGRCVSSRDTAVPTVCHRLGVVSPATSSGDHDSEMEDVVILDSCLSASLEARKENVMASCTPVAVGSDVGRQEVGDVGRANGHDQLPSADSSSGRHSRPESPSNGGQSTHTSGIARKGGEDTRVSNEVPAWYRQWKRRPVRVPQGREKAAAISVAARSSSLSNKGEMLPGTEELLASGNIAMLAEVALNQFAQ